MCDNCNSQKKLLPYASRPFFPNRGKVLRGVLTKAPKEGWTDELLQGARGKKLVKDIVKAKKVVMMTESPKLAKKLQVIFRRQLKVILALYKARYTNLTGSKPKNIDLQTLQLRRKDLILTFEQDAQLWGQAIEEALAEQGIVISQAIVPSLQSATASTAESTAVLLGLSTPSEGIRRAMEVGINRIAEDVTRINDTSRRQIQATITRSLERELTVAETIKIATNRWTGLTENRIPTIVRTELSRAIDYSQSMMYRDTDMVTHISVVGCEGIEQGIPTFNGVATCNIQNVPVAYSGDLRFHPNHTGTMIPSHMKRADGSIPIHQVEQGEGEGTFEETGNKV